MDGQAIELNQDFSTMTVDEAKVARAKEQLLASFFTTLKST
jgi:hypothetical protein